MEQHFLCLSVPITFVLYSKDPLAIFICLVFKRVACHFHLHHHFFHLYNNSASFLMSEYLLLYSKKLYIGITISRSSALSINVLLIFDMHDLNVALFLKDSFFSLFLYYHHLLQRLLSRLQH